MREFGCIGAVGAHCMQQARGMSRLGGYGHTNDVRRTKAGCMLQVCSGDEPGAGVHTW